MISQKCLWKFSKIKYQRYFFMSRTVHSESDDSANQWFVHSYNSPNHKYKSSKRRIPNPNHESESSNKGYRIRITNLNLTVEQNRIRITYPNFNFWTSQIRISKVNQQVRIKSESHTESLIRLRIKSYKTSHISQRPQVPRLARFVRFPNTESELES